MDEFIIVIVVIIIIIIIIKVLTKITIKHKTMMKCEVKSNFIIKAKLSV